MKKKENHVIVHIKADDIYKDIVKYVEKRFNLGIVKITTKKLKNYWINEGRIGWNNHKRTYWIKSKNFIGIKYMMVVKIKKQKAQSMCHRKKSNMKITKFF